MKIRKAVFPVAGLGTRVLPATKAMPKEMLTVVDRPLIQYVVDEAKEAGIEHFIFVTGRNKGVIEDHFDRQFELEMTLRERQKRSDLDLLAQSRQLALSGIQLHRLRPQITLPLVEPAAFAVEPGEPLPVSRGQPGGLVLAYGELGMAHLQRPAALLDRKTEVGQLRLLGVERGNPLRKALLSL